MEQDTYHPQQSGVKIAWSECGREQVTDRLEVGSRSHRPRWRASDCYERDRDDV